MHLPGWVLQLSCRVERLIESLPGMAQPAKPEEPASPEGEDDAKGGEHRASGVITAGALFVIMGVTAWFLDGFSMFWQAVVGTVDGSLMQARVIDHSLLGLLGAMSAAVFFAIPAAFICSGIGNKIYGPVKSHTVAKSFTGIKNHYLLLTATVTAEELFARLLFLGLPLWIAGGHLPLGWFWVLFLVGNGIWAAVHLANFKDPKERHLLRTLPQFVGGMFFTVIFIKFGFFGALLVHLAYNNLLFATMRKGLFNRGELLAMLWHGIVVAVSGFVLIYQNGKSLLDMTYWLSDATNYDIPGWSTVDYFCGVLMVTSLLFIVGDLLQFDLYCDDDQMSVSDNLLKAVYVVVFAFGAFYGLQALNVPFEMRVAVMALIFMVIYRTASGSGMSRLFWIGIPSLMILLCTTLALGFMNALFILGAVALVEAVDDVIRIKDRRHEDSMGLSLAFLGLAGK